MVRNSWSLERKGLVLDSSREFPALFEQLARQTSKLSWPKSQMPTTRPGLRTKTFSSAFDSVTLPLLRLVTSHPLQSLPHPRPSAKMAVLEKAERPKNAEFCLLVGGSSPDRNCSIILTPHFEVSMNMCRGAFFQEYPTTQCVYGVYGLLDSRTYM